MSVKHALVTNAISRKRRRCYLGQLHRVLRSKHRVPSAGLKRKADGAITRNRRQLKEIATRYNLYPPEWFDRISHESCKFLRECECCRVEHTNFVDDEGSAAAPALAEVAVTKALRGGFATGVRQDVEAKE